MKKRLNEWLKNKLTKWVLKNYPFEVVKKVDTYQTVYVKKGRIREWRTFKEGKRQAKVIK